MQQRPNRSQLTAGRMWRVALLAVAALLVFSGAAFAQEGQPADAPEKEAPKPEPGLVVIHVEADGPAAAAGVSRGDIILAVDDDAVNTMGELIHVIRSQDAGDEIVLDVMHGDEARSLTVTLGDSEKGPELGLMAVGDLAVEKRLKGNDKRGPGMPGRGKGQGMMPGMPFGRGQMPDMPFGRGQMPGMPFGRGEGMAWIAADGALVMEVMEESAAAAAGIEAGDVITGLNDATVAGSDELIALLGDHQPGDVVTITYTRDDETFTAEATLGAHPDDETKAYLGVRLAPAAPAAMRMQLGEGMMPFMPGEGMMTGVVIAAVTEDGPAATAGLAEGDWITAVNGEEISDPQELVAAVQAASPGDEMVLTVQGKGDEEAADITVTLGANDEGGALLGVQIGGAMRIQRGPGGMDMDFDFRQFHGQGMEGMPFFHWRDEGGEGMPRMPFFFGRPGGQEDGGRFEFRAPQFRFQTPDDGEDAAVPTSPGYVTEGA